jgi:hypothetical protein
MPVFRHYVIAFGKMDLTVVFAVAGICAVLLLLPWALKAVLKRFFSKNLSYFASFVIVLIASMIVSGIMSHFGR